MLRKLIHPILVLPFCLYINSQEPLLSKTSNNVEEIIQGNENQIFLDYSEIKNITLKNNQELKALENIVNSTTFSPVSYTHLTLPTILLV